MKDTISNQRYEKNYNSSVKVDEENSVEKVDEEISVEDQEK